MRQASKVQEKYAQHAANLLGDEDSYKRQLGKMKRKKFGGTEIIPPEYQKLKVFDTYLQELKDVQFYHRKDDLEYFLIPDLLHELNGNISADGTYHAVKNQPNSRQVYCITKQMFSNGGKKTHCQPIVCVLLPNQQQATYEKMWDHLKELYLHYTGGVLAPTVIHSDNEIAFLNACEKKFPNARRLTCVYHIADNINRHLKAAGFALNNLDCPWMVREQYHITIALLYKNVHDPEQLGFAMKVLDNIETNAYMYIQDEPLEKFKGWVQYVKNTWFSARSAHFIGKTAIFTKISSYKKHRNLQIIRAKY